MVRLKHRCAPAVRAAFASLAAAASHLKSWRWAGASDLTRWSGRAQGRALATSSNFGVHTRSIDEVVAVDALTHDLNRVRQRQLGGLRMVGSGCAEWRSSMEPKGVRVRQALCRVFDIATVARVTTRALARPDIRRCRT